MCLAASTEGRSVDRKKEKGARIRRILLAQTHVVIFAWGEPVTNLSMKRERSVVQSSMSVSLTARILWLRRSVHERKVCVLPHPAQNVFLFVIIVAFHHARVHRRLPALRRHRI